MLYVLKSPGGHLVPETATVYRSDAWAKAYAFLSYTDEVMATRYWKRLKASQAYARRKGWKIVRAKLIEAKEY